MNKNGVDLIIAAMNMLDEKTQQIEYLLRAARAGKLELDYQSYHSLVKQTVENYFGGSLGDFCKMLQEYWGPDRLLIASNLQGLCHGVIHNLIDDFAGPAEEFSDTILSMIFSQIIFFTSMAIDTSSEASAKKLLRSFGEKCEIKTFDYCSSKVPDDCRERKEILDALAEGIMKREGPYKVWQVYNRVACGQKKKPRLGSIDEARKKLEGTLGSIDLSDQISIDECKRDFRELVGLCDGDNTIALEILERVQPGLVGQITDDSSLTFGKAAK